MSICRVVEADSPTLKRSFGAARDPDTFQHCEAQNHRDGRTRRVRSPAVVTCYRNPRPTKRRPPISRSPAMPVQTGSLASAAFPSFMSVFGGGMGSLQHDVKDDTTHNVSKDGAPLIAENSLQTQYPLLDPYQRRESAASTNSTSSDSSPTTTSSPFDSPSTTTDPSPSSSPESPTSLLPLSSFQKVMATPRQGLESCDTSQPSIFFPAQPRSESPTTKDRNVKNLSLNMNVTGARPATASAVEGLHAFSAPTSPLRGPLKTGRRRPNNLTIQTPGFEKTTFSVQELPPTPIHRPYLKHHESSPALPSILSPTTAPLAGMQLPPLSLNRLSSRPGSESSLSSVSASSQGLHDLKEEAAEVNELLNSQEAQERGYPDGPIRIYDSGVYLYLEPSREEASKFDTVINVAKEVANPFSNSSTEPKTSIVSVWRSPRQPGTPEPQTAVSDVSFKSALEWPRAATPASPTTPKATASEPEYIHVPWDHNSEILEDLYSLCQIIESRVSRGRNVLVHCQLGVSRSASLVIAYGLYKGFNSDFHAMYTSVKERSQWVGPNMSLIYQLMDFRTKIANGGYAAGSKPASREWFQTAVRENEMTPKPRLGPQTVSLAPPPPPKSSEIPAVLLCSMSSPDVTRSLPPVTLFGEASTSFRNVSLPRALSDIPLSSPGTKVAIHSSSIPPPLDAPPIALKSAKQSSPRQLPLREVSYPSVHPFEIPSHSRREFSSGTSSKLTVSFAPVKMDLMMQDVPPTPSIFSPRTTEFRSLSFGETNAGDLATEPAQMIPRQNKRLSIFSQPQAIVPLDPRSPHHGDETERIMRNIDEVL